MLHKLRDIIKQLPYYSEEPINLLARDCCPNVDLIVVNWDKITLELCSAYKGEVTCSVDGIHFEGEETMYFIEVSSYQMYIRRNKLEDTKENSQKFIDLQLHEIQDKMRDSIITILFLAGLNKLDEDFYAFFHRRLKIRTILLSDFSPRIFTMLRISRQHLLKHNLKRYVNGDIEFSYCKGFQNRFCKESPSLGVL